MPLSKEASSKVAAGKSPPDPANMVAKTEKAPAPKRTNHYKYIPVLEEILVILLIIEPIWMVVALIQRNKKSHLVAYAASMIAAPLVVELSKFIFEHIGHAISHRVTKWGMVDERPLRNKKQMHKWKEQAWQLVVHTTFMLWEVYILFYQPWQAKEGQNTRFAWPNLWDDPHMIWYPHPEEQQAKEFENMPLLVFYFAELGIWTYTGFSCVYFEHRKKDFYAMLIHHVVTIALVASSLLSWNERAGMLVLFINDACDVSVDVLKMANFLTLDGLKGFFIVEIAFFQMLFFHFYWRIWEGPGRVLYTAFWRAHEMNAYRQSNLLLAMDHRHVLVRLDNSKLDPDDTGITYTCIERVCDEDLVSKLRGVYIEESRQIESGEAELSRSASDSIRWTDDEVPPVGEGGSVKTWDEAQELLAANIDRDLFPSRYTGGTIVTPPEDPWYLNPYAWFRWQCVCVMAVGVESHHVGKFIHMWFESNILLQVLFLLHLYWWYLMLRILFKLINGTPREASEDEYEGDAEDDEVQGQGQAEVEGGGDESSGASGEGNPSAPPANSDKEQEEEQEEEEEEEEEEEDKESPSPSPSPSHSKASLMKMKKAELLALAKDEGAKVSNNMKKDQISEAILKNQ